MDEARDAQAMEEWERNYLRAQIEGWRNLSRDLKSILRMN